MKINVLVQIETADGDRGTCSMRCRFFNHGGDFSWCTLRHGARDSLYVRPHGRIGEYERTEHCVAAERGGGGV